MDFREHLQAELLKRTKMNPRYSQRAFARFLSIQPDYLSKLLIGRRPITAKTISRLGAKLGLAPSEGSRTLLASYGLAPGRVLRAPLFSAWEPRPPLPEPEARPYDVLFCGILNEEVKGARFTSSLRMPQNSTS